MDFHEFWAWWLHRRFRKRLHSPNVVGRATVECHLGAAGEADLSEVFVLRAVYTATQRTTPWANQNVSRIIRQVDAEQVCRQLQRAVRKCSRTVCIARLKGKNTPCLIELTHSAHSGQPGKCLVRLRVWHLCGWAAALSIPSRRVRNTFAVYIGIATGIAVFALARQWNVEPGASLTAAVTIAGVVVKTLWLRKRRGPG
jgi:hypothetical protein